MKIILTRRIIFTLTIVITIFTFFSTLILVSSFGSYPLPNSSAKLVTQIEIAIKPNVDKNIPKKLYPCLPGKVQQLKLVSKALTNIDSYYIVGIYQSLPPESATEVEPIYEETLVKLDDIGCSVIIPKEEMGFTSIIQHLPKGVACELSVQKYRQAIISAGGKKKLEERLFSNLDKESPGDLTYYFPEDICAFNKLGITVPKNLRIIQNIDELLDRK